MKSPAGIRASESYLPELESLRAWAILLVFLYHADSMVMGTARQGTSVGLVQSFMTSGHTGVTLFFVLSAYLLSRPFLREGRGELSVSRSHFFERRVLRIMPLYSVVILFAVLLCLGQPGALREGLYALFFVNSITGTAESLMPYSMVWWSLAVEAQFYLLLPCLGPCMRSPVFRGLGLAVLLAWGLAYLMVANDLGALALSLGAQLQFNFTLLGQAPVFLAGIAAAWLVARHGARLREFAEGSTWLRNGGADLLLGLCLCALAFMLREVTRQGFFPAEINWSAWHLVEGVLWALVVLLVILAPLRTRLLISNRVTAYLGVLSYSLYLLHFPLLYFGLDAIQARGWDLQGDLGIRSAAFAGIFAVAVLASWITYHVIERPFLVRKARID